ncbi:MAG: hypothetical protein A3J49_04050 [Gallionellales bacterium RIFCSPHIGHO2_02_FULL_57_16]|nr:MAG: hypothetical protein A3J49_04050 [Gallionellales bacterium RIFCSPHIGHO2_02_FULL_57_16]
MTVDLKFENEAQLRFSSRALESFRTWLNNLRNKISSEFPSGWTPKEILDAQNILGTLGGKVVYQVKDEQMLPCKLETKDIQVLRYAVEFAIQSLIEKKENTARLSHRQEPQDELTAQIECGNSVLKIQLLADASPVGPFHLSNYLNLETLARLMGKDGQLVERVYDAKFHILMEHSLFAKDLRYFIDQCTMRDRPVSVAYIDIDNFSKFNRDLPGKETQVDRDILPYFMRALEAIVFGKGFAYREGGDEYLVILPNSDNREALQFFEALRKHLASVTYPIEIDGPTVSVGVCTVSPSDRKTPRQIQEFANHAKAHAKTGGRNRVAGYAAETPHSKETLFIFPSEAA